MTADNSEPYIGHMATSLTLAAAPLMFDANTIWERLIIAACGLAGAALALFTDRPGDWRDVLARIGSGVFACQLFGPYIARKLGYADHLDSTIAVYGIMGLLTWYLMGSLMKLLKNVQASNLVERLLRSKLSIPDFKKLEEMPSKPEEKPSEPTKNT